MQVSVEEGYRLASAQRPGRRIVMGPEMALDLPINPLPSHAMAQLTGYSSWLEADCGHEINLWVLGFATLHAAILGRKPTPEDVTPFMERSLSLAGAREILTRLAEAQDALPANT